MPGSVPISAPQRRPALLTWARIVPVFVLSGGLGLLLSLSWDSTLSALSRAFALGAAALLAYAVLERWPRRLPAWLARWTLQVLGVALAIPLTTLLIYVGLTRHGAPPFWQDQERLSGFLMLTVTGVLIAPWTALAALVRQKDALARHQALAFELERSELEREALDARLHLLQRQVAPHFLFNTLANVQALIDIGSPKAAELMRSLIAYLHAAVPRLHEPTTTLGEELALVRAYLELMYMRMPDRLQYAIETDASLHAVRCPTLTLLTLVENAVKHGIDPAEDGGRIVIRIWRDGGRCHLRVEDSGAGLGASGQGLGTGLATLRDRLALSFGAGADLQVAAHLPHGTRADIGFPLAADA
ncbi:sensor histidine kinase [Xanthomonas bundabergensis]|uniref:sensor histidine kinase n=1 Tax=Xanthomonas bundabergensis TaxID=3160842 RepID=UPI00351109E0